MITCIKTAENHSAGAVRAMFLYRLDNYVTLELRQTVFKVEISELLYKPYVFFAV